MDERCPPDRRSPLPDAVETESSGDEEDDPARRMPLESDGCITQYYDVCPEAVVLVSASTHRVISCNLTFQQSLAFSPALPGRDVLAAVFPAVSRSRVEDAFARLAVGEGPACLLRCCETLGPPPPGGPPDGPPTVFLDWYLKRHGAVVVLSGRPSEVLEVDPPTCPSSPHSPRRGLTVSDHTIRRDSSVASRLELSIGPDSSRDSRDHRAWLGNVRRLSDSASSQRHLQCFQRDETARRVQEARQFAELKAHGEMLRQKEAFMQKIFHEIRTPCHTLQMITQLLLEASPEDADRRQQLETAWAQSVHICKLADDVRSALALQAGHAPPVHREWVPVERLVEDLHSLVKKLFPKSTLDFQVDHSGVPRDLHARTDAQLLSVALRQLLTNAMKFTDEGQIIFKAHFDDSPAQGVERLTFSVRNTGRPLDPATAAQLGARHWRSLRAAPAAAAAASAASTLRESGSGLGLGLLIAVRYIQLLGGELQVRSDDTGTQFWFSLAVETSLWAGPASEPGTPPSGRPCPLTPLGRFATDRAFSRSGTSLAKYLEAHEAGEGLGALDGHFPFCRSPELSPSLSATPPHGSPVNTPRAKAAGRKEARPKASRWRCLLPWPKPPKAKGKPPGKEQSASRCCDDPTPQTPGRTSRVLVVEDNAVCQKVLCRCLEKQGFSYDVAGNGQVACEMVAGDPARYDVILMDLRMPVMDGVAATRHIRHQLQGGMPIVVFSAEVGESTLQQVAQAGATDFLPKPASPQLVAEMLRRHCRA
eukprot:EG_transcript_4139